MHTQWGIVVTAVVMFVVTLILGQTSFAGPLIPLYFPLWIMVGWYGYKGDLKSMKNWMKWLIWTVIGGVLFIDLFIGDNSFSGVQGYKNASSTGILIMLIPKIALFYYCSFKLEEGRDEDSENNSSNRFENPRSQSDFKSKTSSYSSTVNNRGITSSRGSAIDNDEIFYEKALSEFETNRRKGLWIKILAKNEGDEVKSKFEYIRIRVKEIEVGEAALKEEQKDQEKHSLLKGKIGNFKTVKISGIECFQLDDGKVLYQMQNGEFLIYSNIERMRVYLDYREKTTGFIGILKKEDFLKSQPIDVDHPAVICVCRKCSLRLRVKNFTGMIKCTNCGHGWLFEKQDSPFKPVNPKIENNSQRKTNLNLKDFLYKNVIMRLISLNYEYGFIFLVWIFSFSILFSLVILIDDYFELGWI